MHAMKATIRVTIEGLLSPIATHPLTARMRYGRHSACTFPHCVNVTAPCLCKRSACTCDASRSVCARRYRGSPQSSLHPRGVAIVNTLQRA
jgi:hypothetical protein